MTAHDFSFAAYAAAFDKHIEASIPGYRHLFDNSITLSRRFVQPGTRVVDIGCSTGSLVSAVRAHNRGSRPGVTYYGMDIERAFKSQWKGRYAIDLHFGTEDARAFQYEQVSFALSLFTLQFIPPRDKATLLKRIYEGLVDGGALIIAEKTLASSSRLQDALTFTYYDYKRQHFTEREILDKEHSLRGQMTLWTKAELISALQGAGFTEIEPIWGNLPFHGVVAMK